MFYREAVSIKDAASLFIQEAGTRIKVFRKYYPLLTGSMKSVRNDVNCEITHAKKVLNV